MAGRVGAGRLQRLQVKNYIDSVAHRCRLESNPAATWLDVKWLDEGARAALDALGPVEPALQRHWTLEGEAKVEMRSVA